MRASMMTTRRGKRWLGAAAMALVGCGDEVGPGAVSGGPCDPATGGRGEAVACVGGALVDPDGNPVVGVKVSACTATTCIIGPTDDGGRYNIQGLPVEPHKIEILGVPKGFMTMVFFQETKPGEMAVAAREVELVPLTGQAVPLPESGGTALVADGKLELRAAADALVYPIGAPEEIEVAAIDIADLPPFDVEPWKGKERQSFAFVVSPFAMGVEGDIELVVKGAGAAAGTPYRIYSADHITARLEDGGMLVADDKGDLVLQPGASIEELTTVVIVPN